MNRNTSRRRFLATISGSAVLSLAGCVGGSTSGVGGSTEYTLDSTAVASTTDELLDSLLLTTPTAIHAQAAVDYSDVYKRSVVDDVIADGTASSTDWPLTYDYPFGTTTRPSPTFLQRDGTYYSLTEAGRSERETEQWVFYLDLVDEEPGPEDRVVTDPPSTLSETDRTVFRRAVRAVSGHGDVYDIDDRPLEARGPNYHHEMDPDASDLVPRPPFDYVERSGQYLVPRAERGTVTVTDYRFKSEAVAESRAELRNHVEAEVVDAEFDRDSLDEATVSILDDVAGRTPYSEWTPVSDAFGTILDELGMAPHIPEDPDGYTALHGSYFSFNGTWYRGSLSLP